MTISSEFFKHNNEEIQDKLSGHVTCDSSFRGQIWVLNFHARNFTKNFQKLFFSMRKKAFTLETIARLTFCQGFEDGARVEARNWFHLEI